MPYLFERPLSTSLVVTYHEDGDASEHAWISEELWDAFTSRYEPVDGRLAIEVTRDDLRSQRWSKKNTELTCWCRPRSQQPDTLSIPRSWLKGYPSLLRLDEFGSKDARASYCVTATYCSPLLTVILQHVSPSWQNQDGMRIVDWLTSSRNILSTGSTISIPSSDTSPSGPHTCRFLVKMTEPSTQGFVQGGFTSVILVPPSAPTVNGIHNGVDLTDSDGESLYDIDEGFLGSALDGPVANNVQCEIFPLSHPLPDDDVSIYVRTTDLSNIGALNGDWVRAIPLVVGAEKNNVIKVLARAPQNNSHRLVRVFANDEQASNLNTAYAAPTLLFNLLKDNSSNVRDVVLKATPFGSRRPPVPVAKSITIARIASPTSTNRIFQPHSLQSLQDYFQGHSRLVKQGDIIAIPLDTDHFRSSWQVDGLSEGSAIKIGLDATRDLDSSNEVIFLMITNMEHDVVATDTSAGADDVLVNSTMGELGCWVDTSITRMMQTGIEHSRVPDIAEYLGLGRASAVKPSDGYTKIHSLVSAALLRNAVDYGLQLSILLKGARGTGKMTAAKVVAARLGLHLLEVNCYNVIGDNDIQTEGTLRARFEKAASCSPCILVLRHVDALSQTTQAEGGKASIASDVISTCTEELSQAWRLSGYPIIVLATTDYPDQMPPELSACFKHEISFEAPDEQERSSILQSLLHSADVAPDVSIDELAMQTAALVASDLTDLVARGEHAHMKLAAASADGAADGSLASGDILLTASDLESALNNARKSYSESIGAPKIPTVSWDDVGGLATVKADILDTIQLPLEHPELFSAGLKKRSGILLYGPPGTGKTLLAKAVATSCNLNFFSVKGPELLNMYIGESEANVRRVFQRARDAKPCVIFFDELDSVAPKRGNQGDSGGVMDRIVSQLLAELDGVAAGDAGADVFVIGATNRPDLLDSALLRPGRFDRMLYLGVSQTHDAQLNILQALTRKFKLHPDLDLRQVAESCPFHYTGADFYALCSDALLKAMSRKAEAVEAKIAVLNAGPVDPAHPHPITPQYYLAEMASPDDIDVLVSQEDFEAALRELVPSVSQAEMDHYARVQRQFSNETINSSTKDVADTEDTEDTDS